MADRINKKRKNRSFKVSHCCKHLLGASMLWQRFSTCSLNEKSHRRVSEREQPVVRPLSSSHSFNLALCLSPLLGGFSRVERRLSFVHENGKRPTRIGSCCSGTNKDSKPPLPIAQFSPDHLKIWVKLQSINCNRFRRSKNDTDYNKFHLFSSNF